MLLRFAVAITGDPVNSTVTVEVRFAETSGGTYYTYKSGALGSFVYHEDQGDIEICILADCVGKYIKVYVESTQGTTLDGSNYFTVNVDAEFTD